MMAPSLAAAAPTAAAPARRRLQSGASAFAAGSGAPVRAPRAPAASFGSASRRPARLPCRAAIAEPPGVPGSVKGISRPDANGRFGKYGGKYVPETLIAALAELESAYGELAGDKKFQARACCELAARARRLAASRREARPRSACSGAWRGAKPCF
jgi:tryptophan synthase beta chain